MKFFKREPQGTFLYLVPPERNTPHTCKPPACQKVRSICGVPCHIKDIYGQGTIWECNCGTEWVVQRSEASMLGHSFGRLKWQRVTARVNNRTYTLSQ